MKIAIMQPYLFPYIGYFQLINHVDFFGVGDDVQYIKSGWINRNKLLDNGKESKFSFSVKKDSHHKNINERVFSDNFPKEKSKFLRKLELFYKKSPYYFDVINLIQQILSYEDYNISRFIQNQLHLICDYLEIKTIFLKSTSWEIDISNTFSAQERVVKKIYRLRDLGVNHFINPVGGIDLYKKDFFIENGYELSFLKPKDTISYKQYNNSNFVPHLSIIDVMMFNSKDEIKELLFDFELN